MATYDHISKELEQEYFNLMKLWEPVGNRQVRVTRHPPPEARKSTSHTSTKRG